MKLNLIGTTILVAGEPPGTARAADIADTKDPHFGRRAAGHRRRRGPGAKNHAGGVIAVVDDGGNLMALERIDGTFAAGANISIGKARTAVLFKKPTRGLRGRSSTKAAPR